MKRAERERAAKPVGGVAHFSTPWGEGMVRVAAGLPCQIRLPWEPEAHAGPGAVRQIRPAVAGDGVTGGPPVAEEAADGRSAAWAGQLEAYFSGRRRGWAPWEIDVAALGFTPFQADVYNALLTVPAGSTVSYGRLAEMAGHPGAARAVGTAMARNPLPVLIPCHRVVKGDGDLGQYGSGGPEWKARLLALERREH